MKKILFSVLVPVYNTEKYIEECINSVLNQKYQNFEIIIVDDGSTDGSNEICTEYARKDDRIKIFHKQNEGVLMARNFAIEKSIGDYCLFLDSDDYWDLDLLETINNSILEYNSDLILFKLKRVNNRKVLEETAPIFEDKKIFNKKNKRIFYDALVTGKINSLGIKAIKRTIIDSNNLSKFSQVSRSEDLLQSLSIAYQAQNILYLNKAMYNYRMHPQSATNNFNLKNFDNAMVVRNEVLFFMEKTDTKSPKNIEYFYSHNCKIVLKFMTDILNTDIPLREKKQFFKNLRFSPFFLETSKYVQNANFNIEQKIRYHLFNEEKFKLFYLYEKLVGSLYNLKRRVLGRRFFYEK